MTADGPTADAPTLPRYVVTGGGEPSPEELAALVIALTPVAVAADEDASPAWVDAALQEGIGRRPFVSTDDLAAAPPLFT